MRWTQYSTRCARPRISLLASWPFLAFAVLFVIGVLLLAISSAMMRSLREEAHVPPTVAWPQLVDESLSGADPQLRLDVVERLRIVHNEWSREILERARDEESDAAVRSAIESALKLAPNTPAPDS